MIPVVFSIDNNYVKQLAAAVFSILKNSDPEACFEFNILHKDVSVENQAVIKSLCKFNKNTVFNFIDINDFLRNFDLEKYMSRRSNYTYISIETYFRFFIPELFPQYKKVLYLDADILVFQDLSELYNENIEGYYAGVVNDAIVENLFFTKDFMTFQYPDLTLAQYIKHKLCKTDERYFNAGVLLLNLEKIRQDKITEKLWQVAEKGSPFEYQDQDVLNIVLEGNVKFLDDKWDVLANNRAYYKNKRNRRYFKKVYNNPAIIHFVGPDKPWCLKKDGKYLYEYLADWWKYYGMTPYFSAADTNILKCILWHKMFAPQTVLFSLILMNFEILYIYIKDYKVHFVLFKKLLRTYIRLKKPEGFNEITSI